ncbi:uncharacterized protein ACBR49_014320 [Aulostomus maculatus]
MAAPSFILAPHRHFCRGTWPYWHTGPLHGEGGSEPGALGAKFKLKSNSKSSASSPEEELLLEEEEEEEEEEDVETDLEDAAQTPAHKATGIRNGPKEMTSSWSNSRLYTVQRSLNIPGTRGTPTSHRGVRRRSFLKVAAVSSMRSNDKRIFSVFRVQELYRSWRDGRLQPITFSVEQMIRRSLPLSLAVTTA